jgi:molybdate transport system permease protein
MLASILGISLGVLFARSKFVGKDLLNATCMLPFVLPPTVIGYILLELLGKNGLVGNITYKYLGWTPLFTWQACVVASFIVALPIMVSTSRGAFETVDRNLENVSYTLGHSWLQTFFLVTLPLASRGLVGGIVLTFARAIGEFGATLMLAGNIPGRTQTMPLAIYDAVQTGQDQLALGLVLLLSVLSLLVLLTTYKLGRQW